MMLRVLSQGHSRVWARGMAAAASAEYDLAVIGSGPGGYVAAIKAAQLGLKVCALQSNAP